MENIVKQVRKQLNMTQLELAKKSGVSRVRISAIENRKELIIKSSTMERISKALEKKTGDIFFK